LDKPRFILFDFGGTLVQTNFDRDRWILHWLSLARHSAGISLEKAREVGDELLAAAYEAVDVHLVEFTRVQFERHLCARLGLSFELLPEELEREYVRVGYNLIPEPGVNAMLKDVQAHGISMGVVSNSVITGRTMRYALDQLGIGGAFEFIMTSADYGFRKPHPQLFKTALARTGRMAGEVWFVGDSLVKDVGGAQGVGMIGGWYNPTFEKREGLAPDFEIQALAELMGLMLF